MSSKNVDTYVQLLLELKENSKQGVIKAESDEYTDCLDRLDILWRNLSEVEKEYSKTLLHMAKIEDDLMDNLAKRLS